MKLYSPRVTIFLAAALVSLASLYFLLPTPRRAASE